MTLKTTPITRNEKERWRKELRALPSEARDVYAAQEIARHYQPGDAIAPGVILCQAFDVVVTYTIQTAMQLLRERLIIRRDEDTGYYIRTDKPAPDMKLEIAEIAEEYTIAPDAPSYHWSNERWAWGLDNE